MLNNSWQGSGWQLPRDRPVSAATLSFLSMDGADRSEWERSST